MTQRLPPLSAIQGFEAAARRLSFKAAAEELNLTQSAVSHQVRSLEDFLGVKLFTRATNRIALTSAGERYLAEVSDVLAQLRSGTAQLQGREETETLAVHGTPAFIARWLTPRLERYRRRHPNVGVKLTTGLPPTDFAGGAIDIVIHWGQEPLPGVRVDPFLASARTPVCSPAYLRRHGPMNAPGALLKQTLLHDVVQDGWPGWFERAGVDFSGPDLGPRFEHCDLTYNAAERGQGVALAYTALIGREIAEGRLVPIFPIETDPVVIYSFACQEARSAVPKIAGFRSWLLDEIELDTEEAAAAPARLRLAD